jgi:hypothetical protein
MKLPYEHSSEFRQAMCPIQERFLERSHRGQPEHVRFDAARSKMQEVAEVHRVFLQIYNLPPAAQREYLRAQIHWTCDELQLIAGERYAELLDLRDSLLREMAGAEPEAATVTAEARLGTITTSSDRGECGFPSNTDVVNNMLQPAPRAACDQEVSPAGQAHGPAPGDGLEFASEAGRSKAVAMYVNRWNCSEASLARTARVHPADLSKWKKCKLPARSEKTARIESALRNNGPPTPAAGRDADA